MDEKLKQVETVNLRVCIVLFALFLPLYGNSVITPAMASLLAAFPDASVTLVTMISQLPMLMTVVGALLVPVILKKKAYYKQIGVASLFVYGFFGILPFWVHDNLFAVLVIRAVYGLGVGFLMPLGAAAYLRLFGDPEKRSKWLGYGAAMSQIGVVIITLLGGFLAAISWEYTFLAYLFAFVCLIPFVIAFRNDDIPDTDIEEEDLADGIASTPGSMKIPTLVWVFLVLYMLCQVCFSQSVMMFASELAAAGVGGPETAGVLLALMTVGGFFGAGLFDRVFKIFGKYSGCVGIVLTALGSAICAYAASIPVFTAGIMILGFGFNIVFPMLQMDTANWVTAARVAMVSGLIVLFMNAGQFLGSFVLGFLTSINPAVNFAPLVSDVGLVVIAIIWAAINSQNKAWKLQAEQDAKAKAELQAEEKTEE